MTTQKPYKVELHCHLDGSLPLDTVNALILSQKKLLSESEWSMVYDSDRLKKVLTAPMNCQSLEEYLMRFDLPLKLLQTPDSMFVAGFGLAEALKNQGVRYAEIRFAPQLHSANIQVGKKMAHEEEIIKSLISGIEYATKGSSLKVNVILCMMRNLPDGSSGTAANFRTLFLADKFLGKGVVAVDLAGAEARDATGKFASFFEVARERGIPFTIHAGESGNELWKVDSIERAIYFGAKRIGHGVGLMYSKDLRQIVKDEGIVVECCPTSNLHTKAMSGGIQNHPIKMLLDEGIKVTLNTDNMTVSDTTLDKEYELVKSLGLTDSDIRLMQMNAVDGAFISKAEKKRIRKREGWV